MKFIQNHLTAKHFYLFLILWFVFTLSTFLIVNQGLDDGNDHDQMVFLTTLASISGPMTGAISRGFQGCCLQFSLMLLPYCLGILLLGIIPQFIQWPFQRFACGVVGVVSGWDPFVWTCAVLIIEFNQNPLI